MTDKAGLLELIGRLEKATGPDRELDAQIWLAVTPGATRKTTHVDHHVRPYDIDETRRADGRLIVVPEYTASIDAALMLVPEGSAWFIQKYDDGSYEAGIKYDRAEQSAWNRTPGFTQQSNAMGMTPALALCIAALRARAQATEEAGG